MNSFVISQMDLDCKENQCGSCEKAFCCFSCRSKHENFNHKKTKPDSGRKNLAPYRNIMFQSHSSLPKIPESVVIGFKNIKSNDLRKKHDKISICIYNNSSKIIQLKSPLKFDDKGETPNNKTKDASTETREEYSAINSLSTEEVKTQQKNKINIPALPAKFLDVTVNVAENLAYFESTRNKNRSESTEGIKNVPSNQICILQNHNYSATTAENTPPTPLQTKTTEFVGEDKSAKNSNGNSSVYYACVENLTKSEINSKLINLCEMSDSACTEKISNSIESKGNLGGSSVYFACSEYFTTESSVEKLTRSSKDDDEFNEFENNPKLASTKLAMTISFTPERYYEAESQLRTETINSTEADYLTANMSEPSDYLKLDMGNGSNRILSNRNNSYSILLEDCSPIRTKAPEQPGELMSSWVKPCSTRSAEESKENYSPMFKPIDKPTVENNFPIVGPSSSGVGDNSFWQSFSNSIQRAYNSTKEICTSFGRKNRSKRVLEDIEERQPEPKRPRILIRGRRAIRDNPRIVFREEGDRRIPVIVYDRETQTDDFLFEDFM